ncbi:MAG: endonuclease III [Thermoprotei archaeon]|nr:MAG: endonuclease III [Thermoprotei archaeon]
MRRSPIDAIVEYSLRRWPQLAERAEEMSKLDAFKLLVLTVLSQVTTSGNTWTAFTRLEDRVGVEPHRLAAAKVEDVEEAIRPAGLWRGRARALIQLAREVVEKFGGDLESLSELPTEELRKALMTLPRVGPKTADVLLLFHYGRRVMPVDTHISRLARRLGIASGGYEDVRRAVEASAHGDLRLVHLALIAFGRSVCRARGPRCWECPVAGECPSRA